MKRFLFSVLSLWLAALTVFGQFRPPGGGGGGTTNNGVDVPTATSIANARAAVAVAPALRSLTNNLFASANYDTAIPWIVSEEGDTDSDDWWHLGVVHGMQNMGRARIIAVVSPSAHTNAARGLASVNHWYGRPAIPVGKSTNAIPRGNQTYVHEYVLTNYADIFCPQVRTQTIETASRVIRRALLAEADNSVMWTVGGQPADLLETWNSPGDDLSPLAGWQIITNKVRRDGLVLLLGIYPDGTNSSFVGFDYNAYTYAEAAQVVNQITNFPITFVNSGRAVPFTGHASRSHPRYSPIRLAHEKVIREDVGIRELWVGREAWGQTTALFPLFAEPMGLMTRTGLNVMTVTGSNVWNDVPGERHRYVYWNHDAAAVRKHQTVVELWEGIASTGFIGQPKGATLETDYDWIGRLHDGTGFRNWLSPFVDFKMPAVNNGTGAVFTVNRGDTKAILGLNATNVLYPLPIISDAPNDAAVLRHNGGFYVSGPSGVSDFQFLSQFKTRRGIPIQMWDGNTNDVVTMGPNDQVIAVDQPTNTYVIRPKRALAVTDNTGRTLLSVSNVVRLNNVPLTGSNIETNGDAWTVGLGPNVVQGIGSNDLGIRSLRGIGLGAGITGTNFLNIASNGVSFIRFSDGSTQTSASSGGSGVTSVSLVETNGPSAASIVGSALNLAVRTNAPGGGSARLVAISVGTSSFNPGDGDTRYFGGVDSVAPTSTEFSGSRVYVTHSGTIKAASLQFNNSGGANGTSEAWPIYIRVAGTTDYLIENFDVTASDSRVDNSSLSIAVSAGDYVMIKMVNPTWATNPTSVRFGGYLVLEVP